MKKKRSYNKPTQEALSTEILDLEKKKCYSTSQRRWFALIIGKPYEGIEFIIKNNPHEKKNHLIKLKKVMRDRLSTDVI